MPDAHSPEAYPVRHRLRVRYAEIDAQAVVYKAHYLMYYDLAITEYLRERGLNQVEHAAHTGCDFHLVSSHIDYHRPIRYDELIDVVARPERAGRSSVTWEVAIFGADGERRSSARLVWVYADLGAARSTPLPADLRRQLELPASD